MKPIEACASATLCTLLGCAILAPLVDRRTPVERAHDMEPRCKGIGEQGVAPLLSPSSIDSVEPAYSYVQTVNDRRANLRGAKIHVKPLTGLSAEAMARGLECHQASVTLGGRPAAEDDPYALPGRWLDFDVSSEGDGFVVLARSDSFDDASRILERAKRFASSSAAGDRSEK
jgi:hypothetical protein